jgi:hypothetical protein
MILGVYTVGINDTPVKDVPDYDQGCRQKGTALRGENRRY